MEAVTNTGLTAHKAVLTEESRASLLTSQNLSMLFLESSSNSLRTACWNHQRSNPIYPYYSSVLVHFLIAVTTHLTKINLRRRDLFGVINNWLLIKRLSMGYSVHYGEGGCDDWQIASTFMGQDEKKGNEGAWHTFSFFPLLFRTGPQAMKWYFPCSVCLFPPPVKSLWQHPQRHNWNHVFGVIQNPFKLKIKTNYHHISGSCCVFFLCLVYIS